MKLIGCVDSVMALYACGVLEANPYSFQLFKTLMYVISAATEEAVVFKVMK